MSRPVILVRGAGDLASGVALRLHRAGFSLLLTEIARPLAVRRRVSFSEAVYAGTAQVEDVTARLAATAGEALLFLQQAEIPLIVDPDLEILGHQPDGIHIPAVVDARLLKKHTPRVSAAFVVGLGPGFVPGENCDAVVETMRGHTLGRVYRDRPAEQNTGLPDGNPDRVLRAPCDGVLSAQVEIGDMVVPEDVLAFVDPGDGAVEEVRAVLGGVLRGMIRSGQRVHKGLKIGDVDPRGNPDNCRQVSDKALAVGGGVLEALMAQPELRQIAAYHS